MAKDKSELEIESKIQDQVPNSNPESEKPDEPKSNDSNTLSLDQIANSLADEMPEVQQHAIDHEADKQEQVKSQYADLEDVDGNSFDPSIHKVNKQGEPTLSTKGKLIKKPGRKSGQTAQGSKSVIGGVSAPEQPKLSPEDQTRMMARASGTMAANLLLTVGIIAGGEEWQPKRIEAMGTDEKAMLETAFADYFEATGRTDIPPGLALTAAIGGYMLPRFTMPKTRTRISKLKDWIKKKWIDRKLKKHGLKTQKVDNKE